LKKTAEKLAVVRDPGISIAVAVEKTGKRIGRIRMRRIPNVSQKTLHGFIEKMVEQGSMVCTDGWPAYGGLTN